MKIKKLTMKSFGSYEEKTVIDFDKISGRGIFLISGDTGSGKSTVFDAIFYALYEELSSKGAGAEGNDKFVSQYRTDMTGDVYVELEFTDKKGEREYTYVIRRSPRFTRKKLRSKGMTEQESKCTLTLLDETLTKAEKQYIKKEEIRKKITELIGLNKDEFRQVGMIAQGEFMEFLRSTTGQKKEVFIKLFNTEIYEKIESSLKEKCNSKKADLKKFTEICKNDISGIDVSNNYCEGSELYNLYSELKESVNNITDKASDGEISVTAIENLLEVFGKVCEDISSQKDKTKEYLDNAQAELDTCKKNYDLGEDIQKRFRELDYAQGEYDSCMKLMPDTDEKKRLISKIENAYKLQTAYDSFCESKKRYSEMLNGISKCEELIPKLKEKTDSAEKDERESEKEYNELNEKYLNIKNKTEREVGLFGELKILKDSLADDEQKSAVINDEIKQKNLKKELYIKSLENNKKRLNELNDICASASDINNLRKNTINLLEDLKNSETNLTALSNVCEKYEEKKKEYYIARSEYKNKNDIYEQSNILFLDFQSGIIARDRLKEGEPCPVCGSVEHPKPCVLSEEKIITREELVKSEKEAKESFDKMSRCSSDCAVLQRDIVNGYENIKKSVSKIIESISRETEYDKTNSHSDEPKAITDLFIHAFADKENVDVNDEFSEVIEELLNRLKQFLENNKAFSDNKIKELDNFAREARETAERIEKDDIALSDTAVQIEESEKKRHILEIEIAKNRDAAERIAEMLTFKSKDEAISAKEEAKSAKDTAFLRYGNAKDLKLKLRKELDANDALFMSYMNQLPKLKEDEERFRINYESELESSGMSEEERKALVLKYAFDTVEKYKKQVHDYEMNLSAVNGKLEMARKNTESYSRPDMERLLLLKEETQKKWDDINEKYISLINRESRNKSIYDNIFKQLSDRQKTAEEFKKTERLYNKITGGESGNRIRLETFVQRYFLKQILVSANIRFRQMTDGQYELRVIDEQKAGLGGRNGSDNSLNLYVYSYENDNVRSIETLSGGETFMASLAIALGITDRIEERSSAVNLDIMFIDEGFGSLDDNARRESVKMLQKMSGGKKQVGIISHVTELKQEIPTILKVYKDEKGSHAEWLIN